MIRNNKKGLSTIVTTLILVLLVLVAVGILWNPVKNLLNENNKAFENVDCLTLDLEMRADQDSVLGDNFDDYTITVTRKDNDGGEIMVKYIVESDTQISEVLTPAEAWTEFAERKTSSMADTLVDNATTITAIPYFISEGTGEEVTCGEKELSVVLE